MAAAEVSFMVDARYEFSAPQYYDFLAEESRFDIDEAEQWFETAKGYEDSPHVEKKFVQDLALDGCKENDSENQAPAQEKMKPVPVVSLPRSSPLKEISVNTVDTPATLPVKRSCPEKDSRALTAPRSTMRTLTKYAKDSVMKKMKKSIDKLMLRENLSQKKQKVEGGHPKQVQDTAAKAPLTVPTEFELWTDRRAHQRSNCNENPTSPFVSFAERVLRFQIKTPQRFRRQVPALAVAPAKPVLRLTVPKEPELETSHRVRPSRVKSSAELEEEMLAKLPKFKARPLNKRILEAPTLPVPPKSNPAPPEFEEFHLRTMERALQHMCSASASCSDTSVSDLNQRRKSAPGSLTEPHEPYLRTATRSRPIKVKSSEELEKEELDKMPKFKARPLNKKMLESRPECRTHKRQHTVPVEFHFATDERFQNAEEHPALSKKLEKEVPIHFGPTKPSPFHLVTEHRGAMKEMKFMQELFEREIAERNLRIPRAQPLPFTTDLSLLPPKPCPKECTKPEPFELESLVRHEEELQRKAEELARQENEEAEMRRFRAQPMACNSSIFVPERSRKPLTEVQEFTFHVDSRAVERAEFDKKVMEKQNQYNKLRKELEAARKVEEDKLIKALRKEMVPQARPMPVFGKPFIPHRSAREPTRAVSPRLRVLARKERRLSTEKRQSLERRRSLEQKRLSVIQNAAR